MSSNKLQLQENNQLLAGYINRIVSAKDTVSNLPEAGGSGGTNIGTCTVTLKVTFGNLWLVGYTSYANGSINAVCVGSSDSYDERPEVVLENVVCNSTIGFFWSTIPVELGCTIDGEGEYLGSFQYTHIIQAPSTNGAVTSFTLTELD